MTNVSVLYVSKYKWELEVGNDNLIFDSSSDAKITKAFKKMMKKHPEHEQELREILPRVLEDEDAVVD